MFFPIYNLYATTNTAKREDSHAMRAIMPTFPLELVSSPPSSGVALAALIALSSLVGSIGVVGVLLVPEWPPAPHDRQALEVVCRRGRSRGPLECPGVPRVIAGRGAATEGDDNVHDEECHRGDLEGNPEGRDRVQEVPPSIGWIGVDASWHAFESDKVKGYEGEIEAEDEQPEVPAAETLAQHPARDLWEPVVDRAEDREEEPSDQHEMEVRDDEVGIVELPVEGRDGKHDARKPGAQELKKEGEAEEHRHLEADLAPVDRGEPVEDLYPRRNSHQHGGGHKKCIRRGSQSHGEHVVR